MTKGQSKQPCPSVYSPATALRSLSSVALSSEQADALYHKIEFVNRLFNEGVLGLDVNLYYSL